MNKCACSLQVYTPKRLQDPTAALDLTLKDPNGNVVYSQFHTNEDEASTPAHGRRVQNK